MELTARVLFAKKEKMQILKVVVAQDFLRDMCLNMAQLPLRILPEAGQIGDGMHISVEQDEKLSMFATSCTALRTAWTIFFCALHKTVHKIKGKRWIR